MKLSPVGAELSHADGQTDRPDEAKSPLVALGWFPATLLITYHLPGYKIQATT